MAKIKLPISIDDHWNCGECNCSHKFYDEAEECCKNKPKLDDIPVSEEEFDENVAEARLEGEQQ